MDAFERSELMIAVIAAAWGENITARHAAREAGNAAELSKLLEERKKILALREAVYRGNVDAQKTVIREYSPVIASHE